MMRVLVVRTDKLGDFITALPTFAILKRHDPSHQLIACVAPLNKALAEACPFIDEVIIDSGQPLFEFVSRLRAAKIDVSITLFSNTRVALAQFLAQIPIRIAPATKVAQLFYSDRVKQRRSQVKMAEFEYNLELTKRLFSDIDLSVPKPLLTFAKDELDATYDAFAKEYGVTRPVVALHPGFGGSSDANWTLDEYLLLVKALLKLTDVQVVMTFGPGEEALREEAMQKAGGADVIFYQSEKGIIDFARLLASFRLFVSTSTGTYHLAALVGTPTMTFFGDSLFASVKRWKAISDETIQHPYMIPVDAEKRHAMFEAVKADLVYLVT